MELVGIRERNREAEMEEIQITGDSFFNQLKNETCSQAWTDLGPRHKLDWRVPCVVTLYPVLGATYCFQSGFVLCLMDEFSPLCIQPWCCNRE